MIPTQCCKNLSKVPGLFFNIENYEPSIGEALMNNLCYVDVQRHIFLAQQLNYRYNKTKSIRYWNRVREILLWKMSSKNFVGPFRTCCLVKAKALCWKPYFDLKVFTITNCNLDEELSHWHSYHIFWYLLKHVFERSIPLTWQSGVIVQRKDKL